MDNETRSQIRNLAEKVAKGRSMELVEDLIETVMGFGEDNASVADLKLFNRALRELRTAARVFGKFPDRKKITVFGSARLALDTEECKLATAFAARMAEHDYMVITGGGDGIMGAAQQGAGAENSFGLNIRLPFEQPANIIIDGDPKLILFRYFFTRKLVFVKDTDAFALFPGGFGTMDEGFEVLTLMQTGKSQIVPIIFFDKPDGYYWESWRRFICNDLLSKGLISESDLNLFIITHDIDVATAEIQKFYSNFHSYRWVHERMVIRIQRRISDKALADINRRFAHLLIEGEIIQTSALVEEKDTPELQDMPRIVLIPGKRDFGMLRLLIDAINAADI
ncbi:MAG: TIGR00730 family Rossman fold protein [Chthoniobacterales bacterium]